MNITGKVINEAGAPIAGAKVDIFVAGTAIAGVTSGSSGGFEFSNETPCAGQELKFVATKQEYEPLTEVTHPDREEVTVELKLREPPLPTRVTGQVIDQHRGEAVNETFKPKETQDSQPPPVPKRPWLRVLFAAGGILVVVLVAIWWPKPRGNDRTKKVGGSTPVEKRLPDLTIIAVIETKTGFLWWRVRHQFSVSIMNLGEADVPNSVPIVVAGPGTNRFVISNGLIVGVRKPVNLLYPANSPNLKDNMVFAVDPDNAIAESNEQNNKTNYVRGAK